ncbi:MAG: Na(+)/H(+) antiporter [Myxococcaceae bacterium]|nr:Na(+)/H(+) antiporter [Myxococcaceae bacterium]
MSPMALLLVLLVLAYIGSLWSTSGGRRAFGSPSGIEYVVLGALLGPHALGALSYAAMAAFEPIAIVALGWIGLIFGLECGLVGDRRAPLGRMSLGLAFTLVTGGVCACAAWYVLGWLRLHDAETRLVLSGAIALVSVETTRHAMQWISEQHMLSGGLAGLVLDLEAADDAPVLVALAVLFSLLSGPHQLFGLALPALAMAGFSLGTGVVLGGVSAYLIAKDASPVERWTVLLGSVWLATGMARSLGLSAMATTFALGATLSAFSRDGEKLREQIGLTEGAVLLPALLLAGAHLRRPEGEGEMLLIGVALALRVSMSFLFGVGLSLKRKETRGLGFWLGAGMLAPGSLTIVVGFAIALRCPPQIARPALAIAFLGTLLGEFVGPRALKQVLGRFNSAPAQPRPTDRGAGPGLEHTS